MFRNVRFYRLDSDWAGSEEELSGKLEEAGFTPCGPMTERSSGWVPIDREAGDSLARRINGADLVRLRSQSRVLPPAAINEELEVRIEEFRKRMKEAPSPRETRRLKAETQAAMLPKAMLKSDKVWGYVDLKEKVIGIDTAREAVAERFLRRLRAPFGDLIIRPLQFGKPVDDLLRRIFMGDAPGQFAVGRECRMRDATDAKSVVRWAEFDLSESAIRAHVSNGMRLTHLGIVYGNVMSCVVDENGVLSKLRFLGMDDDADISDDQLARLDAGFVLLTGTLRGFLGDLKTMLGGYR